MAMGEEREAAFKWAKGSESRYRIDSVLALADDMIGVRVDTSTWDSDPWLLGVPNGVVDLRTGTLRAGRREDLITKHAGAPFIRDAVCPRFELFLMEVFDRDTDLVSYLRKSIGYTLSGDVREDCWFGCYGPGGGNGKTTLFNTLLTVFGDYGFKAVAAHVRLRNYEPTAPRGQARRVGDQRRAFCARSVSRFRNGSPSIQHTVIPRGLAGFARSRGSRLS
jgi:putative DNA primase/helicase